MTDVGFDVDALLGLAIDEALDEERPCEVPKYAVHPLVPPCDEPGVWFSVCPACGFRIAWCETHRTRLTGGGSGTLAVSCVGPAWGGCSVISPLSEYGWERIG